MSSRIEIETIIEEDNNLNGGGGGGTGSIEENQSGMVIFGDNNITGSDYQKIIIDNCITIKDWFDYIIVVMRKEDNKILSTVSIFIMIIITIIIMYKLRVFR